MSTQHTWFVQEPIRSYQVTRGRRYISLTDIARDAPCDPQEVLDRYCVSPTGFRTLHRWESMHNPWYRPLTYEEILVFFATRSGKTLGASAARRWADATWSLGIVQDPLNHATLFAAEDIALDFAVWLARQAISAHEEACAVATSAMAADNALNSFRLSSEYSMPVMMHTT